MAHRRGEGSALTHRYRVHMLVYYEMFGDIEAAIQCEKTHKHYVRAWKINLIERDNPHSCDLYPALPGVRPVEPL